MPNYFLTDANGTKQGPLTVQQLQKLIHRGTITSSTPLETDTGHQGLAGQIPGLNFPVQPPHTPPPPNGQATPACEAPESNTYSVVQLRYKSDTEATPIIELLLDRSFQELRPETVLLCLVRMLYVIGTITLILGSLWYCGSTIYTTFAFILEKAPEGASAERIAAIRALKGWAFLQMLATIPCVVIGCALAICVLRLVCEWSIIITHYTLVWSIEIVIVFITITRAFGKGTNEIPAIVKALRVYCEKISKQ